MFSPSRLLLPALALTLMAGASAQPLTWYLSGVVFNDTGTASGSFNFDRTGNKYTDINVTTTTGPAPLGATYHFTASGYPNASDTVRFVPTPSVNTGLPGLTFFFPDPGDPGLDTPLFATTIFVSDEDELSESFDGTEDSNEARCVDDSCSLTSSPRRFVTKGTVGSSEPLFQYMVFGG